MGVTRTVAVVLVSASLGVVAAVAVSGDSQVTVAASAPAAPAQVGAVCAVTPSGGVEIDDEQRTNAAAIIAAAERAGMGAEGARIGVATALVEGAYTRGESSPGSSISGLRNVPYGHASSIGIFQELAGGGSGFVLTDEQRMDVGSAADRFFTKLARVEGWKSMDPGAAAQAVQRSAHPTRYAERMPDATAIVAAVSGAGECDTPPGPALDCPASGSSAERGLQPNALRVLRCGAAAFPRIKEMGGVGPRPVSSDHPEGRAVDFMIPNWRSQEGNAYGWEMARWLEANAADLNITYIIWDDQIWRPAGSRKGWRPYTHPTGDRQNDTLRHLDHIHVSARGGG